MIARVMALDRDPQAITVNIAASSAVARAVRKLLDSSVC